MDDSIVFPLRRNRMVNGFTMVELLVSMAILVILMSMIFQIVQMTSVAWKGTTQGTGTMQQARVAFERLTRNLSQATLNTYYSYFMPTAGVPSYYMRQSELEFVSGYGPVSGSPTTFVTTASQNAAQVTHAVFFQAPLGVVTPSDQTAYDNLGNLLNACGYFVTYGPDTSRLSLFTTGGALAAHAPTNSNRFRLQEFLQPSEYLSIYTAGAISASGVMPPWLTYGLPSDLTATPQPSPVTVHDLANNIVALIIMPEQFSNGTTTNGESNTSPLNTYNTSGSTLNPTATTYNYDSAFNAQKKLTNLSTFVIAQNPTGNQLPPLVKVVMVAIDEPSAVKLALKYPAATSTSPPDLGNLFTSSGNLFKNPQNLFTNGGVEGDLEKFEDVLNAKAGNVAGNTLKLNYYVFQTDVVIRDSKWTVY